MTRTTVNSFNVHVVCSVASIINVFSCPFVSESVFYLQFVCVLRKGEKDCVVAKNSLYPAPFTSFICGSLLLLFAPPTKVSWRVLQINIKLRPVICLSW